MHVRSALRTLAATGALCALALPAAANADTYTHRDPAHDVQKQTSGKTTNAPTNKNADVVNVVTSYTTTSLTESVKLRGLGRTWYYIGRIKTPTAGYNVTAIHQGGHTMKDLSQGKNGGTPVPCTGLTVKADKVHHRITVTVPSTCLGSAPSVQIGIGFVDVPKAGATFYVDDALRTRGTGERNLTLSPVINVSCGLARSARKC